MRRIIASFDCVGMNYHRDAIAAMQEFNEDYNLTKKQIEEAYSDQHVYKYGHDGIVQVAPEPDNEVDPNAVRLSFLGETIAYVKKEEASRVKELLAEGYQHAVVVEGGKYKAIEDDEIVTGEDPYEVTLFFYEKETAAAPVKVKASGMRILMTVLAVILFVMSLLLLIASPIGGIIGIIFAVMLFFVGRKM